MRVLLPIHRSRGNAELMVGLGVQLLTLGAEVQASATDIPELLAAAGAGVGND